MSKEEMGRPSPDEQLWELEADIRSLIESAQNEMITFEELQGIIKRHAPVGIGYCFDRLVYFYIYDMDINHLAESPFCILLDKFFLFGGIRSALIVANMLNEPSELNVTATVIISEILERVISNFDLRLPSTFFVHGIVDMSDYNRIILRVSSHTTFAAMYRMIHDGIGKQTNITMDDYIILVRDYFDRLYETNESFYRKTMRFVEYIVNFLKRRQDNSSNIDDLLEKMTDLDIHDGEQSMLFSEALKTRARQSLNKTPVKKTILLK